MKHNIRSCLHCVSMLKYISVPRNIARMQVYIGWLSISTLDRRFYHDSIAVSNTLKVANNI